MRGPTETEITALRIALIDEQGGELAWEPDWDHVGIIDNYMPDGPSWCGKAAVFVGGEVCFVTVATFAKNGTVDHMATAELTL